MTVVSRIDLGSRELVPHHTESRCEYQIVATENGQKLLQISTFGSEDRATDGVKQAIQFTESALKELRQILELSLTAL